MDAEKSQSNTFKLRSKRENEKWENDIGDQ